MATVTLTAELMEKALRDVDWAKVDATTDAEIDRQIEGDPDTAPITLPSEAATALIAGIQAKLDISRTVFATRFGTQLTTIQDWEDGRQMPDRTALSYLRVIAAEPHLVAKALAA